MKDVPVVGGKCCGADNRVWILGIHVQHGNVQALCHIGSKRRRVCLSGPGGETDEIVHNHLNATANREPVHRRKVSASAQIPWPASAASPWINTGRARPSSGDPLALTFSS